MGEKIELGLPKKLEFYDHGSSIEIVRPWFNWNIVFVVVCVILWSIFFDDWSSDEGGIQIPETYHSIIFFMVGIVLAYGFIANLLNKTHIYVSERMISIRKNPLPWFGNTDIDSSDVKQLFSKELVTQSKNGTHISYEVQVITNSGRDIKLVGRLDTSEQALYIEQQIEKYLRIADMPIKGEFGR